MSKRLLAIPLGLPRLGPPFLDSHGLRDRRRALRLENRLGLRSRLPRYGEGDREDWRFGGGEASHLALEAAPWDGFRSSEVSMGSGLLDRDGATECRRSGCFLSRRTLLLRERTLALALCGILRRAFSGDGWMRADLDLDLDLVLRRPRSSGLKELMRRRVFLSGLSESRDERESLDTDRLLRLRRAPSSGARRRESRCFRRGGERERERFVEMVEMESADEVERERARLRSSSFFFRISSAMPFFRTRSSGTSVVSLGWSLGLRSCWVREGRDL